MALALDPAEGSPGPAPGLALCRASLDLSTAGTGATPSEASSSGWSNPPLFATSPPVPSPGSGGEEDDPPPPGMRCRAPPQGGTGLHCEGSTARSCARSRRSPGSSASSRRPRVTVRCALLRGSGSTVESPFLLGKRPPGPPPPMVSSVAPAATFNAMADGQSAQAVPPSQT